MFADQCATYLAKSLAQPPQGTEEAVHCARRLGHIGAEAETTSI
jgi:hypothetical protein